MASTFNIYYIIVNSNQTFMPVSLKKIVKADALLLTHAVLWKTGPYTGYTSTFASRHGRTKRSTDLGIFRLTIRVTFKQNKKKILGGHVGGICWFGITHLSSLWRILNDHHTHSVSELAIFQERSFGKPKCLLRYTIRNKTGNQKNFVRNKAIPLRAREPAALWIYAPLRRFHFSAPLFD